MTELVRQNFRQENNLLARHTPVQVVVRGTQSVVWSGTTDSLGAIAVYLDAGQYDYLINGARVPFDVEDSTDVMLNIDGGNARSVYTDQQVINCGGARG